MPELARAGAPRLEHYWLELRCVVIERCSKSALRHFLQNAPKLQELALLSSRLDFFDLEHTPSLKRLALCDCDLSGIAALSSVRLEELEIDVCGSQAAISLATLPKTLKRLKFDGGPLYMQFGSSSGHHFPVLRELHGHIRELRMLLQNSRLPALETLVVEILSGTEADSLGVFPDFGGVIARELHKLPKLRHVRLSIKRSFNATWTPTAELLQQWQRECEKLQSQREGLAVTATDGEGPELSGFARLMPVEM